MSAGYSSIKAEFLVLLVRDFESGKISGEKLAAASDREAAQMLIGRCGGLKGIGDWSAGEVLMITIVTYMIGLGGFSHVVAGSTELFIVMLMGELSPIEAVFGGILPALVGNVIGGTVIFAALAYAQVREEI